MLTATTAEIARELFAELNGSYTGESAEIERDGYTFTVELRHDSDAQLTDTDYWGEVTETRPHGPGNRRPRDYNGAARIVHRDRWRAVWWQPPADVLADATALASLERHVRGWYADDWHYIGVCVTVSRACECCGQSRDVFTGSLWGIESNAGDYVGEVIADVLSEFTPETEGASCTN